MNLDLYAMVQPQNTKDIQTMLDEALAELDRINKILTKILAS